MTDTANANATAPAAAASVGTGGAAASPVTTTAPSPAPATTTAAPAASTSTAAPSASPAGDSGAAPAAPAAASTTKSPTDPRSSLLSDTGKTESPAGEPNGQQSGQAPSKDAATPAPYDIKLPETLKITDQKEFDGVRDLLRDSGVPLDNAPKLVEFLATKKAELESAALQNQFDVWDRTQQQWQDKVMADKTIGGDKWATVSTQLGGLIDEFGKDIPTLRQTLTFTGAGNHPDVVKFLYNVSEALKEGGMVQATKSAATKGKPSRSATLYDKQGA